MHRALNNTLAESYCIITGFQIMEIDLPHQYELSITNTQIEKQVQETKKFEQESTAIRESLKVDSSQADKNITMI